jgi:aldose 1-epimerase
MILLESAGWQAALLPEQGAAFAALRHDGRDVIVPVPAGADPNKGFHGAFWMGPWTNRLDAGRITVGGVVHSMPINRPAENTALHGFFRELPWQVEQAAADHAVLTLAFDRAPFRGRARIRVELSAAGLVLDVALSNAGAVPTPMGFGWHPFFARPPGTRLRFAATTVFDRDARTLPIDPRPTEGLAGAEAALDGLDTHFAGWLGLAGIARPDGLHLGLRAEGAWARNLQVFAPPGAGILCVEPVTHAPDAPNRPAAARHGAMHVLAPGGTLAARLELG